MKILYLTGIKRTLTAEAQKRLDDFEDQDDFTEPRDEHGRTAEWYNDLNLPVPSDLLQKSSDHIKFDLEKDYEEYEIEVLINMRDFVMSVDDEEIGCQIYLSNGNNIYVLEDSSEINAQIWYYSRSIWQKIKDYISKFKNKNKNGVK